MTTKREIVRTIAERAALTQSQTNDVIQLLLEAIVQGVIEDGRIELRNFGTFELRTRAPRKARNPRTGEVLVVPERQAVVFKPGQAFEAQLAELH